MLRRMRGMKGPEKRRLRKRASVFRQRMIAANNSHSVDGKNFSKKDLDKARRHLPLKFAEALRIVESTAEGRKALRRYRAASGLPFPPEIKVFPTPWSPAKGKKHFFAGIGKSPEVQLADGSERHVQRIRRIAGRGHLATDPSGKRLVVFRGRPTSKGRGFRFVGFAPESHYVLSPGEEKAGAFKRGKYWVHSHLDEGGKWPKVYEDAAGNLVYAPGTYSVGKWIRRN